MKKSSIYNLYIFEVLFNQVFVKKQNLTLLEITLKNKIIYS